MTSARPFLLAAAILTASTGFAAAQDQFAGALKARQGQFRNLAFNLGILGSMAKGEVDYDAATAQEAADNLVTVTGISQNLQWPEGSDNGSIDGTRALPDIFTNMDDFRTKWSDLRLKAEEMQAVAGTGQEALGPALGGVGGACSACHDMYRASDS
ncbi:c-type cytochrome [Qingshengfaniella alkalisoli]|uniref:Cytochrome c n=1 Tax=Qingshengfaniella alkalisoli TaxID=2599296 RepID=A0A5B8I8L5_9RHOB|nr:cytochrome c [Qingshengfaniella alkalisoli]QDY69046.1 cytochrome c [Qingshengfaniella alkalisoli]